jgi:hypothetical protein
MSMREVVESRVKLMDLQNVLRDAPKALDELTSELFRRAIETMKVDEKSQITACLQLGLRAASIVHGMAQLLDLQTLDSYEALNRSAIEAKYLLMHFRFDDKGTRQKIGYWFAGAKDSSWKADATKVEEFLKKQGALNVQLSTSWSRVSVLTHPTQYAANNSTIVIAHRKTGLLNGLNVTQKQADYVVGMARLILACAYDFPGWIKLGLNHSNMPSFQFFCQSAELIGGPIVNERLGRPLPLQSITPPKKA